MAEDQPKVASGGTAAARRRKPDETASAATDASSTTNTATTTAATTTATTDEKAATASSADNSEAPVFPTPKYVVTIVSPRTLHLYESDASLDEWKEFEQPSPTAAAENASVASSSTTILNLHVLLVSLLNRLLRARLFPRRAVHSFLTPALGGPHDGGSTPPNHESASSWVVFSILTPANVLPILLSKCEHFGVGNLVGLVYAVPLETCVLPLLRTSIEEEEEEQGLLTVPPLVDPRAGMAAAAAVPSVLGPSALGKSSSTSSSTALAGATSTAATATTSTTTPPPPPPTLTDPVLVLASAAAAAKKKKPGIPAPGALRPTVSESLPVTTPDDDGGDGPRAGTDVPAGAASTSNGTTTIAKDLRPTLPRSNSHPDVLQSTTTADDDKTGGSRRAAAPKVPLLEEIPEAKSSVNISDGAAATGSLRPQSSSMTKTTTNANGPPSQSLPPPANSKSAVLVQKVLDARKEWLATASRIRVEQVAEEVTAAAALTWDYLLFVVCAAAIAATGLATNSSVTVLASMLVSPIMGPILAVTFGTMIRRRIMIQKALRNEAISLLLCIVVGAFGGLMVWWTGLYRSSDWPADEMVSRGETTVLASGVLIALPSGMATALSTLGKNSSGLVGVAISLSLLPPAVNAGLCWMFALLKSTNLVDTEPDDDTNYWKVGTTSFGLTLLNILCIWLAGVFTFWLKEVAPIERKSAFWSRDLKIARQKPREAGAGKIRDGLQAALDLKEKYSIDVGVEDEDPTVQTSHTTLGRTRRRQLSMPISRWEDAIMLDHTPPPVPFPKRIDRASSDGILQRTEALGGFDKASEVLFSNQILPGVDGESMFGSNTNQDPSFQNDLRLSYYPETVPPEEVYQELLWHRYRNPKE